MKVEKNIFSPHLGIADCEETFDVFHNKLRNMGSFGNSLVTEMRGCCSVARAEFI